MDHYRKRWHLLIIIFHHQTRNSHSNRVITLLDHRLQPNYKDNSNNQQPSNWSILKQIQIILIFIREKSDKIKQLVPNKPILKKDRPKNQEPDWLKGRISIQSPLTKIGPSHQLDHNNSNRSQITLKINKLLGGL